MFVEIGNVLATGEFKRKTCQWNGGGGECVPSWTGTNHWRVITSIFRIKIRWWNIDNAEWRVGELEAVLTFFCVESYKLRKKTLRTLQNLGNVSLCLVFYWVKRWCQGYNEKRMTEDKDFVSVYNSTLKFVFPTSGNKDWDILEMQLWKQKEWCFYHKWKGHNI